MPAKLAAATEFGTLALLIPSWERSLRAANKSPKTIRAYGDSARMFETFAREHFGITAVTGITRETLETFIEDQLANHRPTTASVRYRSLQQLFKWLLADGEITSNPMDRMTAPQIPEIPVPVVSDDDLTKLIKVCEGTSFEHKRDTALLRLMLDTGVRLAEVAGLAVDDVDFDNDVILVTGKGRRPRMVTFRPKTAAALDTYRRFRARHGHAKSAALWLGPKGTLTDSGIAQILKRRCAEAGIAKIHPHQLRHTAAHVWLSEGGGEGDAMRLFGWKSRAMLDRYGASAADERARAASRRMTLGDRI